MSLGQIANGRSCLAEIPPEDAALMIKSEWARNGISGDLSKLQTRLSQIRSGGLAYDRDEHSVGISAIGFVFRDWGGTLHAISVPLPSARFDDMKTTIEAALHETKKDVTTLIGQHS